MALMVLASIKSHTLASLAKNKYGPDCVPVGVFEPRWLPVQIGLCAFVRPRVPCVPCVSRLPPVSFYRYRYSTGKLRPVDLASKIQLRPHITATQLGRLFVAWLTTAAQEPTSLGCLAH